MTSNKTIDGRGAKVHICDGAQITLQFVKNVIIHGIHIHDTKAGYGGLIRDSVNHYGYRTKSDGDGISIFGSTNIWINHISMSNCEDGLIDAIQGSTAITISNCHFTKHNGVTPTIISHFNKILSFLFFFFFLRFMNVNEHVFINSGDVVCCS